MTAGGHVEAAAVRLSLDAERRHTAALEARLAALEAERGRLRAALEQCVEGLNDVTIQCRRGYPAETIDQSRAVAAIKAARAALADTQTTPPVAAGD